VNDIVAEQTMKFDLDPASSALLVIDMQYASASRVAGLGALLERMGRADEGEYRFTRIEQLVVPNIARLLDFFRAHDLTRMFVRLGGQRGDYRDLIPQLRDIEQQLGNVFGEREFEILNELHPEPGEPVLTKFSTSAFTSTGIDLVLRNLGARTLIVTGVSTSQCVDLTARDAADRGYSCVVIEDAVAEDSDAFHRSTLDQFARLYGQVATTHDVLQELQHGFGAATDSN
jgi:biuret amidohydrolase